MKKRGFIFLSLFLVLFLVPSISADSNNVGDSPRRIVYVIPGDGLDIKTIDTMIQLANPTDLDNFLKVNGFSNGKEDSKFQQMLSRGEASPLMEEYMLANHRFNIIQSTGVNPNIETFKVSDENSLKDIEALAFTGQNMGSGHLKVERERAKLRQSSSRGLNALKKSGVTLDPGKDILVYIDENPGFFIRGARTNIVAAINVVILSRGYLASPVIAHELTHAGILDGEFYCDQYSYANWFEQNKLRLALTGGKKGCANPYDALGCCGDNPRWWEGRNDPDSLRSFKPMEYEKHLEAIGLGPNCIPLKCWKDKNCICDLKGLYKVESCIGNPCQTGDPHPPYCRDLLGSGTTSNSLTCFGSDGLKLEVIKNERSSTGASSSPSQSR